VLRRALTVALSLTAAGTLTMVLSGVALADDSHQICTGGLLCTGNVVNLHDVSVSNVLNGLHLLGQ
jgi:hypothetical protein